MATTYNAEEVLEMLRDINARFAAIRDLVIKHGSADEAVQMRHLMRQLKLTIRDLDALNRGI